MGRVIVTGSSRGIGKAIVDRYLDEEWTVFGASTTIIPYWKDNPRYRHAVIDLNMFKDAIVPPSDIATLAYRIGTGELKHSTGQTFHINSGSYLF